MKITKDQLKSLIREEIEGTLTEENTDAETVSDTTRLLKMMLGRIEVLEAHLGDQKRIPAIEQAVIRLSKSNKQ
jgi:hypothetical protein|tara:strand:+ start:757 stop:978 length:222 start_codon:yes stop_codon:yes gene_type:complete